MGYIPDENWLKLLQKELPAGKTVADMQFHPVDNIIYNPYIHKAAFTGNIDRSAGWKICADVRVEKNAWKDTSLQALQSGAEAIYISIGDGFDFEHELKDIFLDYIFPIFDLSRASDETIALLVRFLEENYGTKLSSFALKKGVTQALDGNAFQVYEIIEESAESKDIIASMVELCRAYAGHPNENCLLYVYSGNLFFVELARLRAYRILLANLDKLDGRNRKNLLLVNSKTEANIDARAGNALISQTYTCLSAVLGGADLISMMPWTSQEQNWSRISQNIQHLMKHESHLDHFSDPLAGSYFVEDLTEQIVREVWRRM